MRLYKQVNKADECKSCSTDTVQSYFLYI